MEIEIPSGKANTIIISLLVQILARQETMMDLVLALAKRTPADVANLKSGLQMDLETTQEVIYDYLKANFGELPEEIKQWLKNNRIK
jgi:hypothetical protein